MEGSLRYESWVRSSAPSRMSGLAGNTSARGTDTSSSSFSRTSAVSAPREMTVAGRYMSAASSSPGAATAIHTLELRPRPSRASAPYEPPDAAGISEARTHASSRVSSSREKRREG